MAEAPFFSSQGTQYEDHQLQLEQENIASSPVLAPSTNGRGKPRKPPPITPKRFTKFFTPRNTASTRDRQSKAGRRLRDITRNGGNRRRRAAKPDGHIKYDLQDENADSSLSSQPKKRCKLSYTLGSSPPQSSPLKHVQASGPIIVFDENVDFSNDDADFSYDDADLSELPEDLKPVLKPVQRLREQIPTQRIMQRSFGGYDALTRGHRSDYHCGDWRADTANFYSAPEHIHPFTGSALPFCTASCNTNSLVAVGDEEGTIRLLDTAHATDLSPTVDFTIAHIAFRPHRNAIMDIAFSSDDYVLATASGDQTARIIDMRTQQTKTILSGHTSSLKQVRFQPDDDQVLATSSRDGSVQIWDLRCSGKDAVHEFRHSATIRASHKQQVLYSKITLPVGKAACPNSKASGSITAISYLPGRQHLLVTANEACASLKVWDSRLSTRRTPVSIVPEPGSHSKTRNFGVNTMVLSGDGARLYSVCRDSTVYAYSTNHLSLGASWTSPGSNETKAGVGPLYAFRHVAFRTGTFYVKAAVRTAREDRTEMLAVGSSDGTAVVFPTDERHLQRPEQRTHQQPSDDNEGHNLPALPPLLRRTTSAAALKDSLPVFSSGTPLIRGHRKEVTSLTWTHDGDLITLGDDFMARCWREDQGKARELRLGGEGEGKRWGCGWADVGAGWDEHEDEV